MGRRTAGDPLTTFFGREAEDAAIERLLRGGDRLVTLTGISGIGKSRLARRFAERWRRAGENVLICELTDAACADALCATVAAALGTPLVAGQTGSGAVLAVARALAGRGVTLVVLDDFDALAPHAAGTIGAWLEGMPEMRLVVTSQVRLRLPGEVVVELGPLSLPTTDADVDRSDAVRLLWDRVRRVRSELEPSGADRAALCEIARRLDGIPLALELAAARMDVLSPLEVLERLSDRFELLRAGGAVPVRAETLRGAIDWSWSLLSPVERSALAQCAVFSGSFTAAAAEEVLTCGSTSVLDVLQSLHDRSLLRRLASPAPSASPRLALFASVHAYVEGHLAASPEVAVVRHRHAAHYLRRGAELCARLETAGEGLDDLAADQDNLLAVADRALAAVATREDLETALGALVALGPVAASRGPARPFLERLDRALHFRTSVDRGAVEPSLHVRALEARARLRRITGQTKAAAADLEAAMRSAEGHGDEKLLARTATELAKTRFAECRFREAQTLLERVLDLQRRLSDARGEGFVLAWLAVTRLELGNTAEARGHLERALPLLRAAGDRRSEAFALCLFGMVHQEEGRPDDARHRLLEARDLARQIGDRWIEGSSAVELGMTEVGEGAVAPARAFLEEGARLVEDVDPRIVAYAKAHLAGLDAEADRVADAEAGLSRADVLVAVMDNPVERLCVDLQRGLLDLAMARATARPEVAAACRQRARSRAARGRAAGEPPPFDVRRTLRLLERALERMDAAEPGPEGQALLVHPEGRWFQTPGGPRVSCAKRQAMRSILLRLAQHRVDAPGEALTAVELLSAGWRGEKMLPSAARNRLYVTIATLRKIGLKNVLRGGDEGYLLDPAVPCRIVR